MASTELEFFDLLVSHGLCLPSGVPGVYGWSHEFETLVESLDRLVTDLASKDGARRVYFPPVLDRRILVQTGYMQSFPSLCGSVHSFNGEEIGLASLLESVELERDWGAHLVQTDVVLTPAACYPLYPTLAGELSDEGVLVDMCSFIFRHEPSRDPARLQAFRQRENVRVGHPVDVERWRDMWMNRAMDLFGSLGLPAVLEIANDPFFGRGGRMLRTNQKLDRGKFEILCPVSSESSLTAVASFNYHDDKFGRAFKIRMPGGAFAHSACFGFGLERCAFAMLNNYGVDQATWPTEVRRKLSF